MAMHPYSHVGEGLPDYAGQVTFARAPLVPPEALPEGSVAVLGVPIDSRVIGRGGQRWGPRRIREQSLFPVRAYHRGQDQPGVVNAFTGEILMIPESPRVFDCGDAPVIPSDEDAQIEVIADVVARISERGAFPVLLGGDHFVPYPGFTGFARGILRRHPDATFGYLHIDSHLDFWDDMGWGLGRFNHGTSTRRISENPAIKRMAWYGLTTAYTGRDPFEELHRREFTVFTAAAIRRRSVVQAMREALDIVSDGTDYVYVSCDIDVIDGAHAPGTHSIIVGGLTGGEFLDAMSVLREYPKVSALDVCEVLPQFDSGDGRTSRLAALGILAWISPKIYDFTPGYDRAYLEKVFVP